MDNRDGVVGLTVEGRALAQRLAAEGSIVAAVALDGDNESALGWPAAHELAAIEAINEQARPEWAAGLLRG